MLELKARLNIHRDPFGPQPSEVTIDGEWIPQGLGTDGPLQKDSQGVWSITVGPRVPDFYTYTYTVDGVRTIDPANPLIKPGSKLDFIHLIDKKGKAG